MCCILRNMPLTITLLPQQHAWRKRTEDVGIISWYRENEIIANLNNCNIFVPSLSNQMCYFWGSVEIMRTYILDPAVFISFGTISEPATCWASRWESRVTISKLRGENQYAAELQTSVYMSLGSSHFVLFTDLSGSEKSNVCHVRTESGDD